MPTENPQIGTNCPNCGADGRTKGSVVKVAEEPNRAHIYVCGNMGCSVDQFFAISQQVGEKQ